ncbi:hypothetical protein Atai01_81480 [Amycolatopsis taiwanensis]|uniref:Uncharacterized protein n=1 Tax=Amycolatopsis taiwanensis TaxID=342230 RepID=A0A9W6VLD6_9PSEU|nr:hypothetical protein Atai01_81480 [Amycolatopsis taiwanensis]
MTEHGGVLRDETGMRAGLSELDKLENHSAISARLRPENRALLAALLVPLSVRRPLAVTRPTRRRSLLSAGRGGKAPRDVRQRWPGYCCGAPGAGGTGGWPGTGPAGIWPPGNG